MCSSARFHLKFFDWIWQQKVLWYSGACNFYYRGKGVFLCSPGRGLTWSSIARFCGGRCSSTLELATSTIETDGVFLCGAATRTRFYLKLNS